MNRLLQSCEGSALVEFTLVFPLFLLVAFGTVDFTYMLFDWDMANKATYLGARTAVVSNPIASGITSVTYTTTQLANLGLPCFNPDGTANGNCPAITSVVCTPAASSGGSCTGGYTFDDAAFTTILTQMRKAFPPVGAAANRLQRQDVQITYQTNGLGFVGRPAAFGGLPMDVTVSIRCMTHQFFFLGALMNWAFAAPPAGCPAGPSGPAIPAFATTLTSEVLVTYPWP